MKKLFLLAAIALTLSCCNKDEDPTKKPIDLLPPTTQTGEQTFGCLINGEAFVPPTFGNNAPSAFYQFVNGTYTLSVYGSISGGSNLKSINIGCLDMPLIQEGTYLLKEKTINNYFGKYNIGGGITFSGASTTENPGTLTITKYDPDNFIISGTFSFTVLDADANEINITNGRFDMNYTN